MRSTWDLDRLCPGGIDGAERRGRVAAMRERIGQRREQISAMDSPSGDPDGWTTLIGGLDEDLLDLVDVAQLARCVSASDLRSQVGRAAMAEIGELFQGLRSCMITVEAGLLALDDADFERFVSRPALADQAPLLRRARQGRVFRLDPAREALEDEMDRDGVDAWAQLYDQLVGGLSAELEIDGATRKLSLVALGSLGRDPDAGVRRRVAAARATAYAPVRELLATTLTHIAGARTQRADRRGVDDIATSLFHARVSRETLDAVLAACHAARAPLARYMRHKAGLLGGAKLDLRDVSAPIGDETAAKIDWDAACELVVEALGAFHPELGAFARRAIEGGWVDADARPGRRGGAFCVWFPRQRQSRVFLSFTGTFDAVATLAHELGHAWHNEQLQSVPACRTESGAALAESASLFTERLVHERLLTTASSPGARAFLLDRQLRSAAGHLLSTTSAYEFELAVCALRRKGLLEADQLDALMIEHQRRCYGDVLGEPDPTAWCARRHLFATPFYNWSYTFGWLFAALLQARARDLGRDFHDPWCDVLRRCGWQTAEELGREALDLDLTQERTWLAAVADLDAQVDAFVEATT